MFNNIVNIVDSDVEKNDTKFTKAIPIQKHVAIELWRLWTGNSYRSTAAVFDVGKSSAVGITHQFCKFIGRRASNFIKFPRNERETYIALENFQRYVKYPKLKESLTPHI